MTSNLKTLFALAGLMLCIGAWAQHAHPEQPPRAQHTQVEPFTVETWPALLRSGPRPAAYLFTTTYCAVCPQVFGEIRSAARARSMAPALQVVMMDAQGDAAWRHARHFRGLTRLYAFDGFEPAIREAIDPDWHQVTPYVVLIDRRGHVQRTVGSPNTAMLRQWLN